MARRFSEYDDAARRALAEAQAAAGARGHTWIGTEHLVLGLLHGPGTAAETRLAGLGIPRQRVVDEVDRVIDLVVDRERPPGGGGLTPRARIVLDLAEMEARREGTGVSPDHLLRALMREGEGLAARVLASLGVDLGGANRAQPER